MADRDKTEPGVLSEVPSNGDNVLASFYRSVYKTERDNELRSGMMYRPNQGSLLVAFDGVLEQNRQSVNDSLTSDDIVRLKDLLILISDKLGKFSQEKLKVGYQSSSPMVPLKDLAENEICKFTQPDRMSSNPSAIVYLEDGQLKYRVGSKENERLVFDLQSDSPEVEKGDIGMVIVDNVLIEKINKVFDKTQNLSEASRVSPMSIGDTLKIEIDAVKNGEADVSWDEWDKSFDAQTDGFKAAGFMVFGYLDGRGKFYPANSKENVFEICEDTDDVEIIAYNPRPIKVNVKVAGFDKNTGRPTFSLDEESLEG